ncbi:unnamed protein product, partial [marine sediment metagenome]
FDRTSQGTFHQKFNTLWSKFRNGREDNAFVRITVAMDGIKADEAYKTGKEFIELFYPLFLEYVKESNKY